MVTLIVAGLGLTAAAAAAGWMLWETWGAVTAGAFGLVAVAIQATATRLVLRRPDDGAGLVRRWMAGMGLRVAGIVLIVVAALVDPVRFPPLAAAAGFLGVLIPLLALELHVVKRHGG